jgi:hypothetical protein
MSFKEKREKSGGRSKGIGQTVNIRDDSSSSIIIIIERKKDYDRI